MHLAVTANAEIIYTIGVGLCTVVLQRAADHLVVHPCGRAHPTEALDVLAAQVAYECTFVGYIISNVLAVGRKAGPEVTLIRTIRGENGLLTDHLNDHLLITHKQVLCTQAQAQRCCQNKKNRFSHDI